MPSAWRNRSNWPGLDHEQAPRDYVRTFHRDAGVGCEVPDIDIRIRGFRIASRSDELPTPPEPSRPVSSGIDPIIRIHCQQHKISWSPPTQQLENRSYTITRFFRKNCTIFRNVLDHSALTAVLRAKLRNREAPTSTHYHYLLSPTLGTSRICSDVVDPIIRTGLNDSCPIFRLDSA